MSVSAREVSFEVAREGGFPTAEEFEGVYSALAAVDELGLQPLLRRIAKPLVDSYEGDADQRVGFTYADVGLLVAKAEFLVEGAEWALETAKHLREIASDAAEAVHHGGSVEKSPTFDRSGSPGYTPSREALERWGLVKPKGESDAS